jgi:hypothetical protein
MSPFGHKWGLTVLLVPLTLCGLANGDPLTTLYNTGVDASGTPLPDATISDPHYSLLSVPGGSTTDIRVRTSAGGYPIDPSHYIGDDSLSAWIGPNNDPALDGPVGLYDYRTTFDLTGFNPLTAQITGRWTTDNAGVSILLNGVNTGIPATSATQFNAGFVPFSITSGFQAGVNTLDFIINNDGGPTALRVEMTGTAAAPLPTTAVAGMTLLGGFGMVQFARRRKATVAA